LKTENGLRIVAFGFRSIPPNEGCAGADKYADELYPRLVALGCEVLCYNRTYPGQSPGCDIYKGVKLRYLKTISKDGFDSLFHSLKATVDIIVHNTGDIVHILGENGLWSIFLRFFGKRVVVSVDGTAWVRAKWPWYAKLFIKCSAYITAHVSNKVIIDNVFTKVKFERKFGGQYHFIPFGSEVPAPRGNAEILKQLGVEPGEYFLFVDRFIPDKGLHYLVSAFEKTNTTRKLVLVGGSPNPSEHEKRIKCRGPSYSPGRLKRIPHLLRC